MDLKNIESKNDEEIKNMLKIEHHTNKIMSRSRQWENSNSGKKHRQEYMKNYWATHKNMSYKLMSPLEKLEKRKKKILEELEIIDREIKLINDKCYTTNN